MINIEPINHEPKIRYKFLTSVQSDTWTKEDKIRKISRGQTHDMLKVTATADKAAQCE